MNEEHEHEYEYKSLSRVVWFRRGMCKFLCELDCTLNSGGWEIDHVEVHPGLLKVRWFMMFVLRRPKCHH